ncbi:hypothetical protein RND71_008758 [Anisodus tanguticus]|uniref:Uncharacterized protein n=1 Tax=Anisodus tanguticus TaxID=243964 RepID=A0AAE1VU17_9SOLA|nr:hypothetical protein RND71_008758 [Anisodus tanguticus]
MDEAQLGEILGVPTDGLKTIEGKASNDFKNLIVKMEGLVIVERLFKKQLKPEHQLMFELVNKVLLPRAERRCIDSIADLVLLEALVSLCSISFPSLMNEHMIKIVNTMEGKHGLSYGFFLTNVFENFNMPTEKAIVGTRKQIFTMSTQEECQCVPKKGGIGNNSTISSLIEAQERVTVDIERLQAENALLRAQLVEKAGEPGPSGELATANAELRTENDRLEQNIDELHDQMVHDQRTADERIDRLFRQLESLKVFYYGGMFQSSSSFDFPKNLKKLTLSKFRRPWNEILTIGRLPNLEVLKLLFRAYEGEEWEVRDDEFEKLKFLKMYILNIARWSTSDDPFPHLERLMLQSCKNLEEIPSCFKIFLHYR